ncbi:MAG TPA: S9 family peptidase [Candidatus Mcinerneyibacteriales bacterium]|nr:S9 family peptidase [Candidatus Mcinerneyibacteriales bacterium]
MADKKNLFPGDLYRLEVLTGLSLSPDGSKLVYSRLRTEKETEKKISDLFMVDTCSGKERQYTFGRASDHTPLWSPDGRFLAFLSDRAEEGRFQIYLLPSDGGEARPLTHLKGSFASLSWSPDAKWLAFAFRETDASVLEREGDEQKKKLGIPERHITSLFYKFDGAGFLPENKWHIWIVNTATGKTKQLTRGSFHEEDPVWMPDSRSLLFSSNRTTEPALNPFDEQLFRISLDGKQTTQLTDFKGLKSWASPSPDGERIAFVGFIGEEPWWKNQGLWIMPSQGGEPVNLTRNCDLTIASLTLNDTGGAPFFRPVWKNDASALFFPVPEHGRNVVKEITLSTGEIRDFLAPKGVVGGLSFDKAQKKAAYFSGTVTDPNQAALTDLETGKTTVLTKLNSFLSKRNVSEPEEVWFSSQGHSIQGWILKPPGFDQRKQYPSILEIHGGPRMQYGYHFMHEFHVLAARGYVVYFCNPRGSRGYSEDHTAAIWNRWGSIDYDDLMAFADFMEKKPYIDKKRMGVTGGSYGGYMTNWIIGHTRRFKAAVTQRSVSNLLSMWGSSDVNWSFQMEFGGKPPWEDHENFWKQSPMSTIGNAATPTLVIHSENDLRCDIEQGEQVYVALKYLGVDTEMIRFPDEPHGLSRGGRTDRRILRLNHILRWFDKYLK